MRGGGVIEIISQKYEIMTKIGAVEKQWLGSHEPIIEGIDLFRGDWSWK